MQAIYFWPTVALVSVLSSVPVYAANPCVEQYPAAAGEVLTSPGGRVARIEPVAWFEDGVYRITLETGGVIMIRPQGLPMPSVGAELELRVFSKDRHQIPFAGCYCQPGTEVCVEEYTYP